MREIWRDVTGYKGLYQVSNLGRVKSMGRFKHNHSTKQWINETILRPNNVGKGYLQVGLTKNSTRKNYYIHRLVGQCFVQNPNGYKEINHKNENKHDNNYENLEWCTRQYNNNYGTKIERTVKNTDYKHVNRNRDFNAMSLLSAKKRMKKVRQLDLLGNIVNVFMSATEAAKILCFNQSDICSCCRGKLKSAKGYRWEYETE